MIEYLYRTVPGSSCRRKRRIYVFVPDTAVSGHEGRFPVLYMTDGHNLFFDADATYGRSWGLLEYLEGQTVPMMVVGIDCDHGERHGRLREYAPYSFETPETGSIRGRGKRFLDWVFQQLKPDIDQLYPTLPGREHTMIAGSSMGGLISLYALCAYPETVCGAAALSPSLWVCEERLLRLIHSARLDRSFLYMDIGTEEIRNKPETLSGFSRVSSAFMLQGACVTSRIVPGGQHCEASWGKQLPVFMPLLQNSIS